MTRPIVCPRPRPAGRPAAHLETAVRLRPDEAVYRKGLDRARSGRDLREGRTTTHPISLALVLVLVAAGCAGDPDPRPLAIDGTARLEAFLAERPDRPCLVVDIDDTIVDGGAWASLRVYLGLWAEATPPFPGAVEALRTLAERWNVVLITARPEGTAATTRAWLVAHGFPDLPVVYSTRLLPCHDCRVAYKANAIQELARRGLRPVCGIGDKPSDLGAYARCGLSAALLVEGYDDPDWPEARRILTTIPSHRVLAFRDEAWRWLADHLPWVEASE